jgi:diguanylate cyclase (GGDEF)-like protein
MFALTGYRSTHRLFDGESTLVVRAVATHDDERVVIKLLKDGSAFKEGVGRLRHEFAVIRSLDSPWVVKGLKLDRHDSSLAMVMEDIDAGSLREHMRHQRLDLPQALRIARSIALGLRDIHAQNIIHQDLSPDNVIYNAVTGQVMIIDFELSTILPEEHAELDAPYKMRGTLPYMSPEQTGRMNRPVDYRSDFYSLGACFYELLTGRPPFEFTDPIGCAHAHMAIQPVAPSTLQADVPAEVDQVVLKLLAKHAEDRYQSASGIVHDLDQCLALAQGQRVARPFCPGSHDKPTRFKLRKKLYGREAMIQSIIDRFDACASSKKELLLLCGPSGIGKTSIVRELCKPITQAKGYFIGGKFDQLRNEAPYSAILAAFNDLIKIVLSETESRLQAWRDKLLAALGPNGQVIVELFPDLQRIIGPQPLLSKLEPVEEIHRLHAVFIRFLQVCCDTQPLVLFLDDLQWVDEASLSLIEKILNDPSVVNFMAIFAYRDNEVHRGHPFNLMLERVDQARCTVTHQPVEGLQYRHIEQMIADSILVDDASVAPLAAAVNQKTHGNPLFVEQFLTALVQRKLIRFDDDECRWTWDIASVQSMEHTSNVLELMEARIRTLSPETQHVLLYASCIGNRFDLHTLATVAAMESTAGTAKALVEPLQDGLLIPIGNDYKVAGFGGDAMLDRKIEYRFAHDRIQQAAYSLMPESERAKIHVQVGRLLHQSCAQDDVALEGKLFDIVNHINLGQHLVIAPEERVRYLELNRRAGSKAHARAAYELSYQYFGCAAYFGGADFWKHDRALFFALHCEQAQAAYLAKRHEACDSVVAQLLEHASDPLEKVRALTILLYSYIGRGDFEKVVATYLEACRLLGRRYPKRPRFWHLAWEQVKISWQLGRTPVERLAYLQDMPAGIERELTRLDCLVGFVLYNARPDLYPLVRLKNVHTIIRHGKTENAPHIFAAYGVLLCGHFDRIDAGYRFGQLASSMLDDPAHKSCMCRTELIKAYFISHWKEPLADVLDSMMQAYRNSVAVAAHFEVAAYSVFYYFLYSLHAGKDLARLEAEMDEWQESVRRLNVQTVLQYLGMLRQLVRNLRAEMDDPLALRGEHFDPPADFDEGRQRGMTRYLFAFYRLMLSVTLGNFEVARDIARAHRQVGEDAAGTFTSTCFCFYEAIALLQDAAIDREGWRLVRRHLARLKRWSRHQPSNQVHSVLLLQAEILRVRGRAFEAMSKYDEAIDMAKRNNAPHVEALANELCGKFFLLNRLPKVAAVYLEQARFSYALWGADTKVKQLAMRYGDMIATEQAKSTSASQSTMRGFDFDVETLGRVTKSIAEEMSAHEMVRKTLEAAIRMAGAKTGALLLLDDNDHLAVIGVAHVEDQGLEFEHNPSREGCGFLADPLVDYVRRSGEPVALDDAREPQRHLPGLHTLPHIVQNDVHSILCAPVVSGIKGNSVVGVLYLENREITAAFGRRHVKLLEIISSTIAARLDMIKLATTDQLTRLANRMHFDQVMKEKIEIAHRRQQELSLIMIDIDHFKKFNDTYGHQAGDAVLQHVAATIRSCCRSTDLVARYGGEEMCVVMPKADTTAAIALAERIREAIATAFLTYQEHQLQVTASLGVATMCGDDLNYELLVRAADQALYEAKHGGRNQVRCAQVIDALTGV